MRGKFRNLYLGGNTPFGFYSYYNYILDQKKAEMKFCIKGGPGTGKSTFMKSIADYFLTINENVDYFWCSSDPSSIDGILLKDRNVAFVDGTYPHVVDPINPGAVDKILDFSKFWNEIKIRHRRNEIMACNEKISRLYGVAYGYLKYLYYEYQLMDRLLKDLIDTKSIVKLSESCIDKIEVKHVKDKGDVKKFFASAISPKGVVNGIETLAKNVEHIIAIESPIGFRSEEILRPVVEKLISCGYDLELYYCPIDPEVKIEHVYIPEISTIIITCNKYHKIENKLFDVIEVEKTESNFSYDLLKELYKQVENTINSTIFVLKKAKDLHDNLEEYYVEAVDFNAVNEMREEIIYIIENDVSIK